MFCRYRKSWKVSHFKTSYHTALVHRGFMSTPQKAWLRCIMEAKESHLWVGSQCDLMCKALGIWVLFLFAPTCQIILGKALSPL